MSDYPEPGVFGKIFVYGSTASIFVAIIYIGLILPFGAMQAELTALQEERAHVIERVNIAGLENCGHDRLELIEDNGSGELRCGYTNLTSEYLVTITNENGLKTYTFRAGDI